MANEDQGVPLDGVSSSMGPTERDLQDGAIVLQSQELTALSAESGMVPETGPGAQNLSQANPFWSERARDAYNLQQSRPSTLPPLDSLQDDVHPASDSQVEPGLAASSNLQGPGTSQNRERSTSPGVKLILTEMKQLLQAIVVTQQEHGTRLEKLESPELQSAQSACSAQASSHGHSATQPPGVQEIPRQNLGVGHRSVGLYGGQRMFESPEGNPDPSYIQPGLEKRAGGCQHFYIGNPQKINSGAVSSSQTPSLSGDGVSACVTTAACAPRPGAKLNKSTLQGLGWEHLGGEAGSPRVKGRSLQVETGRLASGEGRSQATYGGMQHVQPQQDNTGAAGARNVQATVSAMQGLSAVTKGYLGVPQGCAGHSLQGVDANVGNFQGCAGPSQQGAGAAENPFAAGLAPGNLGVWQPGHVPEHPEPDPGRGLGGGCCGITGVPFRVPGLMGQAGNFREGGRGFDPFGVQGIGHQMGMDPRPPAAVIRDQDVDPLRAHGIGAGQGFANRDEFSPGERTIWELPALGEPDPASSPIQLGDYLALVHPMMSDLAPASSVWWNRVLQESEAAYAQWQQLGPMRRGQLQVTLSAELSAPRFYRLESRAVGMLMKSIPDSAKQEVIASRQMTTVSIIFRLLTIFQPGGMRERGILLSYLNSPGVASTPEEGVAMLRKWGRWISRARGMGASLPDASLLMAGLDQLSSQVLGSYPSIAFRLNLIRTEYRLDHVPEHDTVSLFARSIQSELEQAVISPHQGSSPKRPRVAKFDTETPKGGPSPPKGDSKGESKGKGSKGDGHNAGHSGVGQTTPPRDKLCQMALEEGETTIVRGERVQRLDRTVPPRGVHLREPVIVNLHVHFSCLTMDAAMDVIASMGMMHHRQVQRSLNVGHVGQCIIGNRIARRPEGPRVQNQMVR